MEEFLEKNNLNDLIEIFRENDITLEIAKKLNSHEVKELIPSIGKRKLFTEAVLSLNEESYLLSLPLIRNEIDTQLFPSTSSPAVSESSQKIDDIYDVENFHAQSLAENTPNPVNRMPDFDLKTLLETTPLGITVINFYEKFKRLDHTKRCLLVDIISKKIFNYIVSCRMTHSDYNILTAKIISLFPKECTGTYYVPAISKKHSITNKPIIAKGKLVDKIRNLLRLNRSIKTDKTQYSDELNNTQNMEETLLLEDKLWLDKKIEPWEEVIEKWQKTFCLRRSGHFEDVDAFFKNWPILNDPRSVHLITIDFDIMFPECIVNLHQQWSSFMEKLIDLKRSTIKDKTVLQYLELIDTENCSDDTKVALHFYLLPFLIPPKSRTKLPNKKHWKFSTAEVIDSLIMHVNVPGDIENSISAYRDKIFNIKQTVQPYILIQGSSINNIRAIYVVIDKIRYTVNSVLSALDLTFKIFHVTNACYPIQSEYLWIIIQKCVFHINTTHDKVIPYILDIKELLKNI